MMIEVKEEDAHKLTIEELENKLGYKINFTNDFDRFLAEKYPSNFVLLKMGCIELTEILTENIQEEYLNWHAERGLKMFNDYLKADINKKYGCLKNKGGK